MTEEQMKKANGLLVKIDRLTKQKIQVKKIIDRLKDNNVSPTFAYKYITIEISPIYNPIQVYNTGECRNIILTMLQMMRYDLAAKIDVLKGEFEEL